MELPLQGNQAPNTTCMRGLPPRCKAELSALQAILPNHPDLVEAVSRGIAKILSRATPTCMFALIAILRTRIESDHLIALNLYHADLCIQSTTRFDLDITRLNTQDQHDLIAFMHTALPPDHPFCKYRRSLESYPTWFGDGSGSLPTVQLLSNHPAMPHFLRRVRKFVDRLCATPALDERTTLDMAEKALRDTERARALNGKLTEWCKALRAPTRSAQRAAVAIAGVDKCMEEVRVLATALVADTDVDTPTHSAGTGVVARDGVQVRPCKRRAVPSAVEDPEGIMLSRRARGEIPQSQQASVLAGSLLPAVISTHQRIGDRMPSAD